MSKRPKSLHALVPDSIWFFREKLRISDILSKEVQGKSRTISQSKDALNLILSFFEKDMRPRDVLFIDAVIAICRYIDLRYASGWKEDYISYWVDEQIANMSAHDQMVLYSYLYQKEGGA